MKDKLKQTKIIKQKRLNLLNIYYFKYGVDHVVQNYWNKRRLFPYIRKIEKSLSFHWKGNEREMAII
jgi:hypothetical protein